MKDSAHPAPLAAALRVKDMALDLATDLAGGYRKSTRYFKLRLAVIGGWAVLSLLTMWLACPSSGPSNSLGAEVQIQETLLGTQVAVANASDRMWTDVTLTLDGAWDWHTATFREGQRLVVAASSFTRDGASAPGDLRPKSLTIRCSEGKITTPLTARLP